MVRLPTPEEVTGQFEDAESDDDASPSFVSKPAAPTAAHLMAAALETNSKDVSMHCLSVNAPTQLSAPGRMPSSEADCHLLPATQSASARIRGGSSQPRLVGSRTNIVHPAPTSRDSNRMLMKPTHAVVR